MSSERQKKHGYPLPADTSPSGTLQFCVTIPDDPAFRNAMYAQLAELGKWWNWKRDEVTGSKATESAMTWREVFTLDENCGGSPMSCEDVEDCLETSPIIGGINAEIDELGEEVDEQGLDIGSSGSGGYRASSPTRPLGESQKYPAISEDIVEPENFCDEDDKSRLWAAIRALVYKVHAENLNMLNEVTNYATPADAYEKYAKYIPMLGALPSFVVVPLAQSFAGNYKTAYNAVVTDPFLMDIVEDLFCAAYATCEFDLDDFIAYVANMAGGSYNALVTTFLDVTAALAGQTTGEGVFGALSWLQLHIMGLSEKWGAAANLDNLINYLQGQGLDESWKAYADECYVHSGAWTIVMDFAGDYVKEAGEIVYRGVYSNIEPYTGGSQGSAVLENRYGEGIRYTGAVNSGANREFRVLNTGALFGSYQANAMKLSGTATYFQFALGSPSYGAGARNINDTTFQWTTGAPLVNAMGTPANTPRLIMVMSQQLANQSCVGLVRYIRITGDGELPQFQ